MEVTETELKEEEVTHIYCDECGDECTHSKNYVKRELCNDCTDWSMMEQARATMPRYMPERRYGGRISLAIAIASCVIYPPIFAFTMSGSIRTDHVVEKGDKRLVLIHALGGASWGVLLGIILTLILL